MNKKILIFAGMLAPSLITFGASVVTINNNSDFAAQGFFENTTNADLTFSIPARGRYQIADDQDVRGSGVQGQRKIVRDAGVTGFTVNLFDPQDGSRRFGQLSYKGSFPATDTTFSIGLTLTQEGLPITGGSAASTVVSVRQPTGATLPVPVQSSSSLAVMSPGPITSLPPQPIPMSPAAVPLAPVPAGAIPLQPASSGSTVPPIPATFLQTPVSIPSSMPVSLPQQVGTSQPADQTFQTGPLGIVNDQNVGSPGSQQTAGVAQTANLNQVQQTTLPVNP